MKHDLQKLLASLKTDDSLALSESELSRVEDAVREYAQFKPLPQTHTRAYTFVHVGYFRFAALALILALASTGTVSYAAEGTLPGDTLYPVKIHINERVARALAQTPVARAEVESSLATRRLDEAHALAKERRLTREVRATLESDFDDHADRAEVETEKLHSEDAPRAEDVRARFASELTDRKTLLDEVLDDDSHELSDRVERRAKKLAERKEREEGHRGRGGGDRDEEDD